MFCVFLFAFGNFWVFYLLKWIFFLWFRSRKIVLVILFILALLYYLVPYLFGAGKRSLYQPGETLHTSLDFALILSVLWMENMCITIRCDCVLTWSIQNWMQIKCVYLLRSYCVRTLFNSNVKFNWTVISNLVRGFNPCWWVIKKQKNWLMICFSS